MIDEKKLIKDILQHEDALKDANYVYKNGYETRGKEIIDIIERQPTVEVVTVVHGEWINTDGYDEWTCSECGQEENCDDYPTEYGINFCSRCGADMRKRA